MAGVGVEVDAFEQVAVGDAGGGEEAVAGPHQVVLAEHGV